MKSKKILALVLSLVLMLALVPTAFAANVTFHFNWGTGPAITAAAPGDVSGDHTGGNLTLATPSQAVVDEAAAQGYVFDKWSDGTNTFAAGASIDISGYIWGEDKTFTATWTKVSHTLTFNDDKGDGAGTATVNTDASYTFTAPTPLNSYHLFEGWRYGIGDVVRAGESLVITEDMTFTAAWRDGTKIEYKTDVTDNSVSNMPSDAHVYSDGAYTISGTVPTRNGYTFVNWSDGTNTYAAGATIAQGALPVNATLTLTAQWKALSGIPGEPHNPGIPGDPAIKFWFESDCSSGGSISPHGWSSITRGNDATFTFSPNNGYAIQAVYVDGIQVSTWYNSYTFNNVQAGHKIYVQYVKVSGGNYDDVPKTGDQTPVQAAMILGLLSVLALAVVVTTRKQKNNG